jgi:hypothetical protein
MARKRSGGRTPKLTPEVQKLIVEAVAACAPRRYAAERAGVAEYTVRRWLARGKRQPKSVYGAFCAALKKAEADSIITRVARISKAAQGGQVIEKTTKSITTTDRQGKAVTTVTVTEKHAAPQWTADAWMLERRCSEEFALHRKRDIEDAIEKALEKGLKDGRIKPVHSEKSEGKAQAMPEPDDA